MKREGEWVKGPEKTKLHAYKQDISATLIFKSLHLRFYWPIHCWLHSNIERGEEETDNEEVGREGDLCTKVESEENLQIGGKKVRASETKG